MSPRKLPKLTETSDLKGKYVLLRASLNVPVENGRVTNEFRIARALPSINYLRQQGARTIVVAHIGRQPEETLEPVFQVLKRRLPLSFSKTWRGELFSSARSAMQDGDVLLIENIRQDARETENDPSLGAELTELCDVFVIDAFAAAHRAHASVVGVSPHRPTYFGMNFMHEYDELSRALTPQSLSLFILGGAKFETKIPLVEQLIHKYDRVVIGGALANDIFKAKGFEVGTSLVSDVDLSGSPLIASEKLLLPVDVTVKGENGIRTCAPEAVESHEAILDAGPTTLAKLEQHVAEAKTILWNGPLGNFEAGFGEQTTALAKLIAAAPGYSVVGGGDTIAAIEELDLADKFGFLSTAGGAMLTFLEHGSLPAIETVLEKK